MIKTCLPVTVYGCTAVHRFAVFPKNRRFGQKRFTRIYRKRSIAGLEREAGYRADPRVYVHRYTVFAVRPGRAGELQTERTGR